MTQANVPMIEIDGKQFPVDSLSDAAKSELNNVRLTEQEIVRLQLQIGIAQTARNTYVRALLAQLPAA